MGSSQTSKIKHKLAFSHNYCAINIGALATFQTIKLSFYYSSWRLAHLLQLFLHLMLCLEAHKRAKSGINWHWALVICRMNIGAMTDFQTMKFSFMYISNKLVYLLQLFCHSVWSIWNHTSWQNQTQIDIFTYLFWDKYMSYGNFPNYEVFLLI